MLTVCNPELIPYRLTRVFSCYNSVFCTCAYFNAFILLKVSFSLENSYFKKDSDARNILIGDFIQHVTLNMNNMYRKWM
jgi:hypothetical protein